MSPEFLQSLRELAQGDPAAMGDAEQEAATGEGERATVFRNAQSGALTCSLSRETTQLDDDGRAAVCEALLRLTANSRFSEHPRTGSLEPDGSAAVSMELAAPLLAETDKLDAELDRSASALRDLLRTGSAAVAALDASSLSQEAAWIKV